MVLALYHLVSGETAGLYELQAQTVVPTSSLFLLLLAGQQILRSVLGISILGELQLTIVNLPLCPALPSVVAEGLTATIRTRLQ